MKTLQQEVTIDGKKVKVKDIIDDIRKWMNESMVINRERIIVVKEKELPYKQVELPTVSELKSYDYTGIEYLLSACISIGYELGVNDVIENNN